MMHLDLFRSYLSAILTVANYFFTIKKEEGTTLSNNGMIYKKYFNDDPVHFSVDNYLKEVLDIQDEAHTSSTLYMNIKVVFILATLFLNILKPQSAEDLDRSFFAIFNFFGYIDTNLIDTNLNEILNLENPYDIADLREILKYCKDFIKLTRESVEIAFIVHLKNEIAKEMDKNYKEILDNKRDIKFKTEQEFLATFSRDIDRLCERAYDRCYEKYEKQILKLKSGSHPNSKFFTQKLSEQLMNHLEGGIVAKLHKLTEETKAVFIGYSNQFYNPSARAIIGLCTGSVCYESIKLMHPPPSQPPSMDSRLKTFLALQESIKHREYPKYLQASYALQGALSTTYEHIVPCLAAHIYFLRVFRGPHSNRYWMDYKPEQGKSMAQAAIQLFENATFKPSIMVIGIILNTKINGDYQHSLAISRITFPNAQDPSLLQTIYRWYDADGPTIDVLTPEQLVKIEIGLNRILPYQNFQVFNAQRIDKMLREYEKMHKHPNISFKDCIKKRSMYHHFQYYAKKSQIARRQTATNTETQNRPKKRTY